ncbi:hypothetical protein OF001_U20003 [Pseudomonas sp. OF001]|nr:hypothetical protein OF001_U20003 [Pseudomonas sp. OF001]
MSPYSNLLYPRCQLNGYFHCSVKKKMKDYQAYCD